MARHQAEWFERLEADHDNLRRAIAWLLGSAPEKAVGMCGELWWFWYKRGYWSEGSLWLEKALAAGDAPTPERAEALNGAGVLARNQADFERARNRFEESLALRRELGDEKHAADVLINLGTVVLDRGDYQRAEEFFEESLKLKRRVDDRWGVALTLNNLGVAAHSRGDCARAAAMGEESLELFREIGDKAGVAMALGNIGEALESQGELHEAARFYRESLSLHREVGEKPSIAILTCNLGGISHARADYDEAAKLYRESLLLNEEIGDKVGIAASLEGVASVWAALGRAERAIPPWAAAEALREEIGAPLPPIHRDDYERAVATVRERLGEKTFAAAWAAGRGMTPKEAAAEGEETKPPPSADGKAAPDPGGLSVRELEVLRLVARGLSNVEAGNRAFISPRTVDAHLRSIYKKLEVNSRTAATRCAVERGLL